jgi:hypothetical protein
MQSAVGVLGVNGENGVFCRSCGREIIPLKRPQGSVAGESAPKKVTAEFGCHICVGFHQSLSNGLDHADSHRRANGSSGELVRTLNICHCGDYHEEALGFLQPQPKHIPLYTKYQQLLASE